MKLPRPIKTSNFQVLQRRETQSKLYQTISIMIFLLQQLFSKLDLNNSGLFPSLIWKWSKVLNSLSWLCMKDHHLFALLVWQMALLLYCIMPFLLSLQDILEGHPASLPPALVIFGLIFDQRAKWGQLNPGTFLWRGKFVFSQTGEVRVRPFCAVFLVAMVTVWQQIG